MSEIQRNIRFFTISDYKEEEEWLRAQHKAGWALCGITAPCFYRFEKCEPEDMIYRLDYINKDATAEYRQMFADYGWEDCGRCVGWYYYRKPAASVEQENDGEIFSDDESRMTMVQRIVQTRMLPLMVIFLCCILPQLGRAFDGGSRGIDMFITVFFGIMFLIYMYLFIHCGTKLMKIKKELKH